MLSGVRSSNVRHGRLRWVCGAGTLAFDRWTAVTTRVAERPTSGYGPPGTGAWAERLITGR